MGCGCKKNKKSVSNIKYQQNKSNDTKNNNLSAKELLRKKLLERLNR